MITTGAKFWFAVVGLALAAAVAWFVASGGEYYGTMVLVGLALAATVPGLTSVALRDGDVPTTAEAPGTNASVAGTGASDEVPARTALSAPWPALGALGVATAIIGLAVGGALFYVGMGILAITLVEWMVQGWAERATAEPAYNAGLRRRIMNPVEVPALAVIVIAVVVLAFSRVLLATSADASIVITIVFAVLIFGGGALLATRPRISSSLLTGAVVVLAVVMLGGGIVGAVAGERDFEEHGAEGEGGSEGGAEQGEVYVIAAEGTSGFTPPSLQVPAGRPFTIRFENRQQDQDHNLALQEIGVGEADDYITETIAGGESAEIAVPALAPGSYTYISSVIAEMEQGTLEVVEEIEGGTTPVDPEAEPGDDEVVERDPTDLEQSSDGDGGEPQPEAGPPASVDTGGGGG